MKKMFEIYTKPNCEYCVKAKILLNEKNLEFKEYVIGQNIDRETVLKKFPQIKTVPVILKNGEYIGGYQDLTNFFRGLNCQ